MSTFRERFCYVYFTLVAKAIDPFRDSGLFLYPLNASGKHWFSDVFRGYTEGTMA